MREMQRQKAAMDIAEAISVVQMTPQPPAPPPQGALGAGGPQPPPGPQGALGASSPGGGPAANKTDPLQMLSSFRSPPMAAALQGAEGMKGHPSLAAKPVGFAHGGFVVTRRR